MNDPPDKPSVFISYSRKDAVWRDYLTPHLRTLEQQGHVVLWDDQKIDTGENWFPAIEDAIAHADVAVCLISADFLASDFITKEEIPGLLERRQKDGMLLLPIYARACPWQTVRWLERIQMFPDPEKPLATFSKAKRDQALAEIAEYIYDKIRDKTFTLVKPPSVWAALADEYVSTERLPKTDAEIFGRDDDLALLDNAWESETTHIISFVAWGGVGKSALVNKWVEQAAEDNYRGAGRVYAWSFYSQGTGERVTSADMFINDALRWFGDEAMAASNRSGWDKGQRLAELVQQGKTLLLLDGLEPLQSDYEHDRGQVKDPALRVLVEELAISNPGLCVITTREKLPGFDELAEHAIQKDLEQISPGDGRALLHSREIRGTDAELEQATRDFGNHALAVNILAAYLQDEPARQIAHARLIPDLDISVEDGRHPRRVMEAFARKFQDRPELNVLNITGLFDRPASAKEIKALRTQTTIPELTDRIRWLTDDDWERTIRNLRGVRLLAPKSHHDPGGLDAHPLVREHFGQRLREGNEESWKQGHSHLYEHLSKIAPRLPETLEEMAPLFLAVAHGCKAGRHPEAYKDVYWPRIQRKKKGFPQKELGAVGADLAAIRSFFVKPWTEVVSGLEPIQRANLPGMAGNRLRAMGRLVEAVPAFERSLESVVQLHGWENAALRSRHLSEASLILGDIVEAVAVGEEGVAYADRSGADHERVVERTVLGDALHQAGKAVEAAEAFREAERIQREIRPGHPMLSSLWGFRYCDLLLSTGDPAGSCKRAETTLAWADKQEVRGLGLLDAPLDRLTIGKALLAPGCTDTKKAEISLSAAIDGIRESGKHDFLPLALLARALLRRVQKRFDEAESDLSKAESIATRGEMRLYECDCHLECARLHLARGERDDTREHLDKAKEMVDEMGYHRRDPALHLGYTRLLLAEGNTPEAREHFTTAKKLIDDMGAHGHDWEVAELEAQV